MTIFYFATCGLGGVTERMAKKALLLRHPVRGADAPAPQRETWSATGGVICVSGTVLICFWKINLPYMPPFFLGVIVRVAFR